MLKKIIRIIILVIIIFSLIGIYAYTKPKKVEKLSNVTILDCYDREISNYQENKMPFTIQKNNENQTIKVNGTDYEDGERCCEVGEYKIEVTDGTNKEVSIVKINDIERSTEHEYSIYINSEVLPTLIASLDIASKTDLQGYFWTRKSSAVDIESMQANTKNLVMSSYMGNEDETDFKLKIIQEVKDYIKDVLTKDEDAYFYLYHVDYRFYLELELFGKIGLSDNRYSVTMYSDGTSSYVKEYATTNYFFNKEYAIREENGYEDFVTEKANYEELIINMRSNKLDYNYMPGSYMVLEDSDEYNYNYLYLATLRDNVKYLLQFPEVIDFKDERVAEEMKDANLIEINLREEYSSLTEEQKKIFLDNIGLDKETLDANYFEEDDAKYLVITGTKPYYGDLEQEEFEDLIKQVYNDYSEEYIILYKPHPSALPDEEQQQFLDSMNIKTLPGTIPMEAIIFIYPNLKLGGFASSLYMTAEKGQTLFFFAENEDNLVEPLNYLYEDLFNEVKFYN